MSRKSKAKITITVNPVAPERIDSPSASEVSAAPSVVVPSNLPLLKLTISCLGLSSRSSVRRSGTDLP